MASEPTADNQAVAVLPGWLFLFAGLAVVAGVWLTPAWVAVREVRAERDLMRDQLAAMQRQTERYREFERAVLEDDPLVLERLAFTQLRLKPAGVSLPEVEVEGGPRRDAVGFAADASVDAWLAEPVPAPPAAPGASAVNTRLTRLTTGVLRLPLLLAGMACVVGGLWCRSE